MMNRHISISRSCKKYTPSVATRPVGLLTTGLPTSRSVASVPIGNSEQTAQVIETVSRRFVDTLVIGNTRRKSLRTVEGRLY